MERLADGISRIQMPFCGVHTPSYILENGDKVIILDCGFSNDAATEHILPHLGDVADRVEYIVLSHIHEDHSGGLDAVKKACPNSKVALFSKDIPNARYLENDEIFIERFKVLHLPGHTPDSIALYDTKTRMLLSSDCLQMYGLGQYAAIGDFAAYYRSVEKVCQLNPKAVITAHEFRPLGMEFYGDDVYKCLYLCKEAANFVVDFVKNNRTDDNKEVAKLFNTMHPNHPTINEFNVGDIYRFLDENGVK